MHYIYKIMDTLNNKIYIGQTIKPDYRWYQHRSYAVDINKHKQYIHRAMAKYGIDNFTFQVIDVGLNRWQADCLETNYIETYDSRNKQCGYNLAPGGGGVGSGENHPLYGKKQDPETINKRVEKLRGQKRTDEQRANISAALKALDKEAIYTKEVRQHMSDAHVGIKDTEETKQKKSSSATQAWDKRNAERFAVEDIRCQAPGCNVVGKAKYKIIDGIRYCNKHGLRMLRYGRLNTSSD